MPTAALRLVAAYPCFERNDTWRTVQHQIFFGTTLANGTPTTSRRQKKVRRYLTRHPVTLFTHTLLVGSVGWGGSVWLVLHAASGRTRRYQRRKEFGGGVPIHANVSPSVRSCITLLALSSCDPLPLRLTTASFMLLSFCFTPCGPRICSGRRKWSWQQQLPSIQLFGAFCGR